MRCYKVTENEYRIKLEESTSSLEIEKILEEMQSHSFITLSIIDLIIQKDFRPNDHSFLYENRYFVLQLQKKNPTLNLPIHPSLLKDVSFIEELFSIAPNFSYISEDLLEYDTIRNKVVDEVLKRLSKTDRKAHYLLYRYDLKELDAFFENPKFVHSLLEKDALSIFIRSDDDRIFDGNEDLLLAKMKERGIKSPLLSSRPHVSNPKIAHYFIEQGFLQIIDYCHDAALTDTIEIVKNKIKEGGVYTLKEKNTPLITEDPVMIDFFIQKGMLQIFNKKESLTKEDISLLKEKLKTNTSYIILSDSPIEILTDVEIIQNYLEHGDVAVMAYAQEEAFIQNIPLFVEKIKVGDSIHDLPFVPDTFYQHQSIIEIFLEKGFLSIMNRVEGELADKNIPVLIDLVQKGNDFFLGSTSSLSLCKHVGLVRTLLQNNQLEAFYYAKGEAFDQNVSFFLTQLSTWIQAGNSYYIKEDIPLKLRQNPQYIKILLDISLNHIDIAKGEALDQNIEEFLIRLEKGKEYIINENTPSLLRANSSFIQHFLKMGMLSVMDNALEPAIKDNQQLFMQQLSMGAEYRVSETTSPLVLKNAALLYALFYYDRIPSTYVLRDVDALHNPLVKKICIQKGFTEYIEKQDCDLYRKEIRESILSGSIMGRFQYSDQFIREYIETGQISLINELHYGEELEAQLPNYLDQIIEKVKEGAPYSFSSYSPHFLLDSSAFIEATLKNGQVEAVEFATDTALKPNIEFAREMLLQKGKYQFSNTVNPQLLTKDFTRQFLLQGNTELLKMSPYVLRDFSKDEEVLNYLIENRALEYLTYFDSTLVEKKVDLLVETTNMDNCQTLFSGQGVLYSYLATEPKIIEKLLQLGKIEAFYFAQGKAITPSNIDLFVQNLTPEIAQKATIQSHYISVVQNRKIIEKLIEYGNPTIIYALNDNYFKEYVVSFLKKCPSEVSRVINYIHHRETLKDCYTASLYTLVKPYLMKLYEVTEENLDAFVETFGYVSIDHLDSKGLQDAIHLSREDLKKYTDLFKTSPIQFNDIRKIYDTFYLMDYKLKNPDDYTLFTDIKNKISQGQELSFTEVYELSKYTSFEKLCQFEKNDRKPFAEFMKQLYNYNIFHELPYLDYENKKLVLEILQKQVSTKEQQISLEKIKKNMKMDGNKVQKFVKNKFKKGKKSLANQSFMTFGFTKEYPTFQSDFGSFSFEEIGKVLGFPYEQFLNDEENQKEVKIQEYLTTFTEIACLLPELEQGPFLDVINSITNKRIDKRSGKYISAKVDEVLMDLQKRSIVAVEYNETKKENIILDSFLSQNKDILLKYLEEGIIKFPENIYTGITSDNGEAPDLFKECLAFMMASDKKNYSSMYDMKLIKSKVKDTKAVLRSFLKEECLQKYIDPIAKDKNLLAPATHISLTYNEGDVLSILSRLDVNRLKESVFSNPEIYDSLKEFLDKHKCTQWSRFFEFPNENFDIKGDASTVTDLIDSYCNIYKGLEKRGDVTSLPEVLKSVALFSYDSIIYSTLFNKENLSLLKINPGPNSASMGEKERLSKAMQYMQIGFTRDKILVPPFDEIVSIDNEKKQMEIIVGDFKDPENLTLGERTGACMRIGGVGSELFDFCLTDEAGFHVRFKNPATDKLVSRVSGFVNGNTVFLNELRFSLDSTYTNENVIEACKKCSEMFILKSKQTGGPIQNVVIHNAYATSEMIDFKIENLGITNNKEGLHVSNFYSDIKTAGIVLATERAPFVPIELGNEKAITYDVLRNPYQKLTEYNEIVSAVQHLQLMNYYIENNSVANFETTWSPDSPEYLFAYVGDDWFISLKKTGDIEEAIVGEDERAKIEFASAKKEFLKQIEPILQEIKKVEEVSYVKTG